MEEGGSFHGRRWKLLLKHRLKNQIPGSVKDRTDRANPFKFVFFRARYWG